MVLGKDDSYFRGQSVKSYQPQFVIVLIVTKINA